MLRPKGDHRLNKDRKRMIGGIQSKILLLIMITAGMIIAAFVIVTVYQNRMLSALTSETSIRQRESIGDITGTIMDQVVRDYLTRVTEQDAENTNNMFDSLRVRIQIIGDYAEKMFRDPDAYPRLPWSAPDPSLNGQLSAMVVMAHGTDLSDPAVADRIGLLANLSDLMLSVCSAGETNNICIGIKEGVMLTVNTVAGDWVYSSGIPSSFDPRSRYWYREAQAAGELVFTDMEVDHATGKLCVTCALPIYDQSGELQAVVSGDLFLEAMQKEIQEFKKHGRYIIVVNEDGHVILSPKDEGVFQVRSSDKAQDLRTSDNVELAAFVTDALQGNTGIRKITVDGAPYYAAGVPMETVGWTMISVFSEEAAMAPSRLLQNNYLQIESSARDTYNDQSAHSHTITGIILTVLFILLLTAAQLMGRRIVKPLNTITRRISEQQEGELEFKMDPAYRTGDEIEVLAESFAALSHKTMDYVEQVRQITAEKERIGTELSLATRIQADMLPNVFPAFPDRTDFDIYAVMDPAKEVGGDFYDFFLIDSDHLCMVIADVSGKGIPAALFMMASKIILANNAMMGKSPAQILKDTNSAICANNREQMFVTVWLGILELTSGKITAANAGHEYPVLKRAGGGFELMKDRHGFVIGAMEDVQYREYEIAMHPGDKLFVYTDGLPEATNAGNELFGTQRMMEALNERAGDPPKEILKNVRLAVDRFVGDAPQFDDLTMLCMEYKG